MTIETMTTIDRLCLALDAGDDSVLPILADALEDAQDSRAGGVRVFAEHSIAPRGGLWGMFCFSVDAYRLLYNAGKTCHADHVSMAYPTRSAAFLALAAALDPEETR